MTENPQKTRLFAIAATAGLLAVFATTAAIGTQAPLGLTAHDGPDADTAPGVSDERGDGDNESIRERDDDNETRTTLTGTLNASAGEDYRLGGVAVDIGAEWYTSNTTAETDFDGDGTVESIRAEFDGLVGQNVTVTVETDGTEGDVFAVGGDQYREAGPPPWAGGPHGHGPPDHAGPPR